MHSRSRGVSGPVSREEISVMYDALTPQEVDLHTRIFPFTANALTCRSKSHAGSDGPSIAGWRPAYAPSKSAYHFFTAGGRKAETDPASLLPASSSSGAWAGSTQLKA